MDYQEITMANKCNLKNCQLPFCVEHVGAITKDPLHIHDFHQLTVITHGSATLVLNGISYPVRSGDAYVISSFSTHRLTDIRDLEFTNALFYLKDLEAACGELAGTEGFRTLFYLQPVHGGISRPGNIVSMDYQDAEMVNHLLNCLHREQRQFQPGSELVIRSGFLMLITYLSRMDRRNTAHRSSTYSQELLKAVDYLEKNCADPIALSDICTECAITEHHLRSLFEKIYGCTPMNYLWNLRIQRACFYLTSTDLPIAEIAAMSGFEDNNYFSRKFRKELGMTPRDYRAQSRAESD